MLKSFDNSSIHNSEEINLSKDNLYKINKNNKYAVKGEGNSISGFYIANEVNVKTINFKNNFIKFNSTRETVIVGSSTTFQQLNNFLLDKKYIFYSSPSYPYCTIGAGVALNVHGVNPSIHGTIKENIISIKFFNPDIGLKETYPGETYFDLIVGSLGMFGLVVEVELKVNVLKYNYAEIKKQKINDLIDGYNFLLNNNYISANNFFNLSKIQDSYKGIVLLSNRYINLKNKIFSKIQNEKKYNFYLPILSNYSLNKILQKILLFKESYSLEKIKKTKEVLFRSHDKTYYKNLFGNIGFFEHQILIPHSNVERYLNELKIILYKFKPIITLCHMKLFNGERKYLEFDGKGLGLAFHIVNNINGNYFINNIYKLDEQYKCFPNISKNSNLNLDILNKRYSNLLKKYHNSHKKYSNFYFKNRIFT